MASQKDKIQPLYYPLDADIKHGAAADIRDRGQPVAQQGQQQIGGQSSLMERIWTLSDMTVAISPSELQTTYVESEFPSFQLAVSVCC